MNQYRSENPMDRYDREIAELRTLQTPPQLQKKETLFWTGTLYLLVAVSLTGASIVTLLIGSGFIASIAGNISAGAVVLFVPLAIIYVTIVYCAIICLAISATLFTKHVLRKHSKETAIP